MQPSPPHVTVGALLRARAESLSLGFELLAGAGGLDRGITSPYVLKTGLALAGFDSYLQEGRVLVFGASEVGYLNGQDASARAVSLAGVMARHIPCVLVTDGLALPPAPDAFLVFRNIETDAVSVVFRRKDGDVGLIEPRD